MAVEFYDPNDRALSNVLFSLTDKDFDDLKSILIEYYQKTGLRIDQYGKTMIYQDHVKLILKLLSEHIDSVTNYKVKSNLTKLKERFGQFKDGLLAIGD